MFENIGNFFKKMMKTEQKELLVDTTSKDAAKERLHIVLMQDRANVSADFLELMKQEIIDVIKKYIVIDEEQIDVRLTNQENEDGTTGAPSLYANIPILNIRNDIKGEVLGQSSLPKEESLNNVDFSDRTVMIQAINEEDLKDNNANPSDDIKKESTNKEVESDKNSEVSNNNENTETSTNGEKEFTDIDEELSKKIDAIEDDEEDDDDDVTFDDLLKAAEEEEKKEAEEKKEEEEKNAKSQTTTKKTTSTTRKKSTGKGKKKGSKSSSKKKK